MRRHFLFVFCYWLYLFTVWTQNIVCNDTDFKFLNPIISIKIIVHSVKPHISTYNAGDPGLIPELGRFPGEGNGNPLQYSCLENHMDRGTWRAIVPVAESDTTEWLTHNTILQAHLYKLQAHPMLFTPYTCLSNNSVISKYLAYLAVFFIFQFSSIKSEV